MLRRLRRVDASYQQQLHQLWADHTAQLIRTNYLHDRVAVLFRDDEDTNPPTTETMEDDNEDALVESDPDAEPESEKKKIACLQAGFYTVVTKCKNISW